MGQLRRTFEWQMRTFWVEQPDVVVATDDPRHRSEDVQEQERFVCDLAKTAERSEGEKSAAASCLSRSTIQKLS